MPIVLCDYYDIRLPDFTHYEYNSFLNFFASHIQTLHRVPCLKLFRCYLVDFIKSTIALFTYYFLIMELKIGICALELVFSN